MIIYKTQYTKNNKLNPIIYEYTDVDLELNLPCEVMLLNSKKTPYEELPKLNLYPIKVTDYNTFIKYSTYLIYNREHLQLDSNVSLLTGLIYSNAHSKCKKVTKVEDIIEKIPYALEDVCELLKMVTHIEFEARVMNNGSNFIFIGKRNDELVIIDSDNFETIRNVILQMNLLQEELIFKTKELEKYYRKAIKAEQKKNPPTEFSDIILTVVESMKCTFDYIVELNIFQLYALYRRISHVKHSDAITLFRTVTDNKKLPNISFNDGIIKEMYRKKSIKDVLMSEDELRSKV